MERTEGNGDSTRGIPRMALSKAEALGVSVDFLEEHVMGELRVVRRGRRRLIPLSELQRWLDESSRGACPRDRDTTFPGCPAASDGPCTCAPTFRAIVYSQRDARKIQQTFPTLSAAKIWRQDALVDLRRGKLPATPSATLREVAEQWLQDAAVGTVLNRSGDRDKPSVVLRGYEQALRTYVLPDLGAVQFGALQRRDVQSLAERIA